MPVCRACLRAPEPLAAEYFCVSCRTPFQNHFPAGRARPLRALPLGPARLRFRLLLRLLRRHAARADSSLQVRPDEDRWRSRWAIFWRGAAARPAVRRRGARAAALAAPVGARLQPVGVAGADRSPAAAAFRCSIRCGGGRRRGCRPASAIRSGARMWRAPSQRKNERGARPANSADGRRHDHRRYRQRVRRTR